MCKIELSGTGCQKSEHGRLELLEASARCYSQTRTGFRTAAVRYPSDKVRSNHSDSHCDRLLCKSSAARLISVFTRRDIRIPRRPAVHTAAFVAAYPLWPCPRWEHGLHIPVTLERSGMSDPSMAPRACGSASSGMTRGVANTTGLGTAGDISRVCKIHYMASILRNNVCLQFPWIRVLHTSVLGGLVWYNLPQGINLQICRTPSRAWHGDSGSRLIQRSHISRGRESGQDPRKSVSGGEAT